MQHEHRLLIYPTRLCHCAPPLIYMLKGINLTLQACPLIANHMITEFELETFVCPVLSTSAQHLTKPYYSIPNVLTCQDTSFLSPQTAHSRQLSFFMRQHPMPQSSIRKEFKQIQCLEKKNTICGKRLPQKYWIGTINSLKQI